MRSNPGGHEYTRRKVELQAHDPSWCTIYFNQNQIPTKHLYGLVIEEANQPKIVFWNEKAIVIKNDG